MAKKNPLEDREVIPILEVEDVVRVDARMDAFGFDRESFEFTVKVDTFRWKLWAQNHLVRQSQMRIQTRTGADKVVDWLLFEAYFISARDDGGSETTTVRIDSSGLAQIMKPSMLRSQNLKMWK
jgi:hypothetical protein